MGRRNMCNVIALLLAVSLLVIQAEGALLASSRLVKCVANEPVESEEEATVLRNCKKKFILTVSVSPSENLTETIHAVFKEAVTEEGETVRLKNPWRISWGKRQPRIRYPLTYEQMVNNRPHEKVIKTSVLDCKDGGGSGGLIKGTTCGEYVDRDGVTIPHSQGFCCGCSLADVIAVTSGRVRGQDNCAGQLTKSAHCLRFDPLWYDVYSVSNAQVDWTIGIAIKRGSDRQNTEFVEVSPRKPIAVDSENWLLVRAIGDFSPYETIPSLSHMKLIAPHLPVTHPRVKGGSANAMLLESKHFALDGKTCNRIGVSFEAFQAQGQRCKMSIGDCLHNQPEDFYQADEKRRTNGETPLHFLQGFGEYEPFYKEDNQVYLSFRQTQSQASLIQLVFSADDVVLQENEAPGVIIRARIEDFEAQSRNGILYVTVQNTGAIRSGYFVSVGECSAGIAPIQSQSLTMEPGPEYTRDFKVYSEHEMTKDHNCIIALLSSQGNVLDTLHVNFTTTEVIKAPTSQGGDLAGPEGKEVEELYQGKKLVSCKDKCPNIFDVMCFVGTRCWSRLLLSLLVFASIAGGAYLLFLFARWYMCRRKSGQAGGGGGGGSTTVVVNQKKTRKKDRKGKSSQLRHSEYREEPRSHHREIEMIPYREFDQGPTTSPVLAQIGSRNAVFFNLASTRVASQYITSPGSSVSIAGRLARADGHPTAVARFVLDDNVILQRTAFSPETSEYRELNPPHVLDRSTLECDMGMAQIEQFISVTPKFHCVNLPPGVVM